ncbi:flavodoxin family protein [Halodesulfovibrio spirochaetisodalis]|uniref:NADPH-dependent FMN reductase n=1 Tax=Halodesulfovibrio spirochaetisodalis TaxID=1560234 RepID=A0A1B7XB89_9BACT|nr:flavodoxin family protein [Halodesulfovibrio spirochaetisodalis]OBQ46634.1 NADPH-dependent FMN reductase [Halodesulfovibrio spirochaetisodalis]
MKILTLLGSGRPTGNTATALQWAEEELRIMGHEVEQINLVSKNIKPCLGCANCKESETSINCIQRDDAEEILQKMIDADITVFASPTYFWGYAAPVKALMDRSWSLVTNYKKPNHASLLEGKRQGVLLTGGSEFNNNAEGLTFAFNKLQVFYKTTNCGELFIERCTIDNKRPADAKERAMTFAKNLVA